MLNSTSDADKIVSLVQADYSAGDVKVLPRRWKTDGEGRQGGSERSVKPPSGVRVC